jgi:hypothetical protein
MCAPEFPLIQVPTPIIINGIPFDEEVVDPQDLFIEDLEDLVAFDFADLDDVNPEFLALYITDSDSSVDYDQLVYPDFEDSEDPDGESSDAESSNPESSDIDSDFQDLLDDYLLVRHGVLRSYDRASAIAYSRWMYENMSDFPAELDDFIETQLGIVVDIMIMSALL